MRRVQVLGAVAATGMVGGCSETEIISPPAPEQAIFHAADAPPIHQVDSYEQIQKPEVDILWVIDNSCSMAEEQEDLGDNFPLFMQYFLGSSLDYHIGVVTTDMYDTTQSGKLVQAAGVRWITPETPNPEEVFAAMSLLGTGGSGDEQGLLATYAALELQDEYNDGFIRDTSALHIIVVSDEGDHSPPTPVTLPEEAEYLNGLRSDPEMVTFNSIVAPPELCDHVAESGALYTSMTDKVGGVFWSLCDENWVGALEEIGLASAGLKREYFLTERPVPGTVKVTVEENGYVSLFKEFDQTTLLGDWTYSEPRNSVTFLEYIPNPGAVVHVDYDILSAAERNND